MKHFATLAIFCLLVSGCCSVRTSHPAAPKTTFSSFDQPEDLPDAKPYGVGEINFKRAHLEDFLVLYRETSGRTVISSSRLPGMLVTVQNQTPVNRIQVLQLFDTVLAESGVAMVYSGENTVKAVPMQEAAKEAGPVIDLPADKLPESASYMVRIVRLKKTKPSELVPMLQPFSKVPNGIIAMDKEQLLVLRDFSSNIRQMLRVIDEVQKSH